MTRLVLVALSAALVATGVSAFAEKMDPGENIMTTVNQNLYSYTMP